MIELAKKLEKVKVNYQPQPNQWGGTFTCVCRNFCWEALLSCNEPSCNQTSDGCGFLWLYPCTFDCTLGGA
ncbi:MAG: bacteriocin fulvocin C-related protein [Ignavibacteriae bacterium]|nr:bacteriocin fulvocin C-related protein [Ignavibacteriota bacterium]